MITEDSINFLKNTPPFQFLDRTVLKEIADNLSFEFFPKNSMILSQGGPPSESLRVIKKGGVKVFLSNDNDEIVIDYKSEGDSFGYISLLSADKSRANVLAIEDTLCYLLPKEIIHRVISKEPLFGEYFMKSFFRRYLDKTYKEMRNKNLLFKEGEKVLYTTPVSNLVSRNVVTTSLNTPVKEAAAVMSQNTISSLLIVNDQGEPQGIITDRDLRDKVVAKGLDLSTPSSEIMSPMLVTIDSRKTCFDALATMIQHNIHHLLVAEGKSLKGVVTNHDFMILQGTSPLSLLKTIERQESTDELSAIHNKINQVTELLFKEGVKAVNILRIITELHDRLLQKIIELSIGEIGDPPSPFAFFVYGSEGRREETFKTVFRCAIVYEDNMTPVEKREMEEFCRKLLVGLQQTLKKCVLPLFDTHPFGDHISIFGDCSDWQQHVLNSLRSKDDTLIATAKKFLDLRSIYGDKMIVKSLRESLFRQITGNYQYKSVITEYDPGEKSLVGFFRQFIVDESGTQSEKLDIKEKGIRQVAGALRALAIAHNLHETSTIERLNVLYNKGLIPDEIKNDANSAFEFLLHLLLQSQLMKKDINQPVDNLINPEKLSLLEKKTLKEVFQIIPDLQKKVRGFLQEQALTA
jgi:CBS domain-containing protein